MVRKYIIALIFTICCFSAWQSSANAEVVAKVTVKELIVKHAKEMGLDPALALSIAKTESNFRHDTQSRHGAVGVFQLMPVTAKKMGYNPYHVSENIKGGIAYYKMMYKMFGSTELALAAYNAGPGNVKKYNGVPPFSETQKFVSKIMTDYKTFKTDPVVAAKAAVSQQKKVEPKPQVVTTTDTKEQAEIDFRRERKVVLDSFLENQAI